MFAKHMKHWLAMVAALLCSLVASAHDFEVDGIYYNIISEESLTVEVTFKGYSRDDYVGEYSGSINLPAMISYEGVSYNVIHIGNDAFYGCGSLLSVTIPESVTSIGISAFSSCPSLTTVIIPASVTHIGDWAFPGCYNLTSVNIPKGVTSIGYGAFWSCRSLTSVILPDGVRSIGEKAFQDCQNLISITIPESVMSIGNNAFYYCRSLTDIKISGNSQLTSIGYNAFENCSSLTSITIPNGVTEIKNSAFGGCSSLTSITFLENVTSIGWYVFDGCSSLASITCHATTPPTIGDSDTFRGVNKSIPVCVPEGSVTAYKAAACWNEFSNIQPIRQYYLKNVGSGKFLTAANSWGTQASLGEHGLDVTVSKLTNDKYTIETRIKNGATDHYLGSNLYMDAPEAEWIITALSNGNYTLSLDGTHYIGYDGSSVVANTSTDPTSANVQWQFLTKEDLIAEMENARDTAPVNATFFIDGANFSRNDQRNAAWRGEPVLGGHARTNFCAEKWNIEAFDVYQELAVPNGYYQVTMQGFYRGGSSDNHAFEAVNRHENGTEALNATFYANEKEMPLMSIAEGALNSPLAYGTWDETSVGYLPNSMESAASAFSEGLYEHSIWVHVTDGVLRLGVKKEVGEVNDWTIFDNFELYYYGSAAITISDTQASFSQANNKRCLSITYTRNFKNTNWQALYVPFEIPVTEELLEEFEVSYIYNTRQYDRDDDGVKDETIIEAFKMTSGSLEANYPYLIRAKVAGVKDIVVTNATLYATEENSIDCSSVFETYTFTGTYSRMSSVLLPQDEGYYALSGGEWRPVADGTSLGAFRFYMKIDSRNGGGNNVANARSIRMRFVGDDEDDETTGVESSTLNSQPSTLIYDLQGRRVDNPTKGVYIVNGKKVLVR